MKENQMVATQNAKRMNNNEINNRSSWNNGDNVIGKNYRAKNDFENAPIGAVAIITVYSTEMVSGDKVEQWKKIGKDEWIEIDAKTYCQLYDQYNGGKETYELVDNGQFTYGIGDEFVENILDECSGRMKDSYWLGRTWEIFKFKVAEGLEMYVDVYLDRNEVMITMFDNHVMILKLTEDNEGKYCIRITMTNALKKASDALVEYVVKKNNK